MYICNKMLLLQIPIIVTVAFLLRKQARNIINKFSQNKIDTNNIIINNVCGLKNLYNTCYMNSILQSLYSSNDYREYILNSEFVNNSIGYELKQLFLIMNDSNSNSIACNTNKIAKSLDIDITIQEDAEEFYLKLINNVDNSIKNKNSNNNNKNSNNLPSQVMKLRTDQIINCLNIDYIKHKYDNNLDLSLDIQECDTISNALDDYFSSVLLNNDNQYNTNEYGLQDAEKSLLLTKPLPKLLVIHLKRFSFNYNTMEMSKLGNPLKIPFSLNIKEYLNNDSHNRQEITSDDAITDDESSVLSDITTATDSSMDSEYELNAVVIHEGSLDQGHYYCVTKQNNNNDPNDGDSFTTTSTVSDPVSQHSNNWIMLNDDAVVPNISSDEVRELSEGVNRSGGYSRNAYMLFYTKKQ